MNKSIIIVVFISLAISYISFTHTARADTDSHIIYPEQDSMMTTLSPDSNYGSGAYLTTHRLAGAGEYTYQSLIEFDLSFIPENATIVNAILHIYATGVMGSNSVKVRRVTESWDESTVTWNTMPSYDSTVVDDTWVSSSYGNYIDYNWNVTSNVASFVDGTYDNYGWHLCVDSGYLEATYHSSNKAGTSCDPYLYIDYELFTTHDEYPTNQSTEVELNLRTVNVTLERLDYGKFNWTIGGECIETNTSIDDTNGSKQANIVPNPLPHNTRITWWTNVSCAETYINNSYYFDTISNSSPIIANATPFNNEAGIQLTLGTISFDIFDDEGDLINYSIITYPDVGTTNINGVGNGTKTFNIQILNYSTNYYWNISITDGHSWRNRTYNFTTVEHHSKIMTDYYVEDTTLLQGFISTSDMFYISVKQNMSQNTTYHIRNSYNDRFLYFFTVKVNIDAVKIYGVDNEYRFKNIDYYGKLNNFRLKVEDLQDYNGLVVVPNPGFFEDNEWWFNLFNDAEAVYRNGETLVKNL